MDSINLKKLTMIQHGRYKMVVIFNFELPLLDQKKAMVM